jgi:uncharacterized protein
MIAAAVHGAQKQWRQSMTKQVEVAFPAVEVYGEKVQPSWVFSRRGFVGRGLAAAGAAMVMPHDVFAAASRNPPPKRYTPDYGPLQPAICQATGLPLLQLPAGFSYTTYGWTGDPMDDGSPTPSLHDGMGVCAVGTRQLVLMRNHERYKASGSFASTERTFDDRANGGTTRVLFDYLRGEFAGSDATLSGTLSNCAGGPTPWSSWLTCEETFKGPHTRMDGGTPFKEQHGWVFDVPAEGLPSLEPLRELGAFKHEACAVDPATGIVYETEDDSPGGFYRFIPKVPGRLAQGGKLQMMKLDAEPNASIGVDGQKLPYFDTGSAGVANGTSWKVSWVTIDEPERMFVRDTKYGGVRLQGLLQGASGIARGEGCWYGNGVIYFCATIGGVKRNGQVFAYDPRRGTLTQVYESTGAQDLNYCDNITWSPRGSLLLCEDGTKTPQYLRGLTLDGIIFPFCANNLDFSSAGMGDYTRPSGKKFKEDFRDAEFTGATFHNNWLFFNIQTPGITFAVTGPWENGAL